VIPNSKVFGSPIENVTHHPKRRVDVNVRVEYGAGIDATRRVLEQAARSVEFALENPAPAVMLAEMTDTGVRWMVMIWTMQQNFGATTEATITAVKTALHDAGIAIATPRMDLNINNVSSNVGGGASQRVAATGAAVRA
jgi:small conductance mechanosensitive channel